MKLVLVGQPNCGKSTIFNAVAGYRSATANFPGSSVTCTMSRVLLGGREIDLVDLPGLYSLASTGSEQREALSVVLARDYDVIVNVVDASRLGRSLELTLQLLELGKPVVLALNMVDEATYHGIEVDHEALAAELGIPVVPTVGRYGRGLRELFRTAMQAAGAPAPDTPPRYDREVEAAIERIGTLIAPANHTDLPTRMVAIKCLNRDPYIMAKALGDADSSVRREVDAVVTELSALHGWSADQVVAGSRHTVAHRIEDRVTTMHQPHLGLREHLNRLLVHPVSGGPLMVLILGAFFYLVYGVGQRVEAPLVKVFDQLRAALHGVLPVDSLLGALAGSVLMGISGGVAIVLPYLLPFLIGLAILEDTGYLPRIAYILDSFMHRIGLHGKSVLPIILGYGCSVPAIMATRILESPRDRRITATLAAFVPCSARTVVIYGLVAAYMGPLWALAVYLLNIVVVVSIGSILAQRSKVRSPGLILEMPDLRLPTVRTLLAKTWLSLKEFITVAWPLLIGSSAVLGLLEWLHADAVVNTVLAPLTVAALGLPAAVGVSLVFGVLRKELTLVMLVQALGTAQVASVMTTGQLMTFTLFVVFYVPCVATVAVLAREVGWKYAALISGLAVVLATTIGVLSRVGFALFG
jgi:ferrous iron transport protein B